MIANRSTVQGILGCCVLLLISALQQAPAQPYLRCLIEATNSHEIIILPYAHTQVYDSVQLAAFLKTMPVQPHNFGTFNYSSLQWNTSYHLPMSADWYYPEAIYNATVAGQVVAAGPLDLSDSAASIAASGPDDTVVFWNPHVVGVRAHLFAGGSAVNSDTLLRINIWHLDSNGRMTYNDSGEPAMTEARSRSLCNTLAFTKADFIPTNQVAPDYAEYQESFHHVDFQCGEMRSPIDTPVNEEEVYLEVIYVGGETLALHSITVRDSIYHLLTSARRDGDAYRQRVLRQIDTLLGGPVQKHVWTSLQGLSLTVGPTAGPTAEITAGSFQIRRMIHDRLYLRCPLNVDRPFNDFSATATIHHHIVP